MNLDDATIAVVGLGYVGPPLAVGFGGKRPGSGFDIRPERIAELRRGAAAPDARGGPGFCRREEPVRSTRCGS